MSGPSYIDRYAEPLGEGRAVMRVDTVLFGDLVESHTEGSPAPLETVRRYERRVSLEPADPWGKVPCRTCGAVVLTPGGFSECWSCREAR